MTIPNSDPNSGPNGSPARSPDLGTNSGPPFPKQRAYYLFLKIAIALMALWLTLHFTGML